MDTAFLTDLLIMLVAAVIVVPIFQFLKLGTVPGFLITGIVVGPSVVGLITNISDIRRISEFGVVFLLFVIGMELKPKRLWLMRKMVFGLGTVQVLLTGTVISAIAYIIFDVPLPGAILIGPALALSSTAFVLQLLTEQKMLATAYGRGSFAVLLLQDLAVVPLLALVSLLSMPALTVGQNLVYALLESALIITFVIIGGRFFLQPILHIVAKSQSAEIFTATAVLLVAGTAVVMEHVGLSMALGAFLAGLLIADSSYRHQVMAEIQPFRGILLGLFFMSMGMSLDLRHFFNEPVISITLVLSLLVIKTALLLPLTRLFKIETRCGLAISLILAQSGEFALVLFAIAYQNTLLSDQLYQYLLLVVLLSMLATPPLARIAYRLVSKETPVSSDLEGKPAGVPIVLAGFGRVGHRIGTIMEMMEIPYLAIDKNADIVAEARENGQNVFYGDVRQPEVLRSAGISNDTIMLVTLDDFEANEKVIATLRQLYPDMQLLVRGHSREQCKKLLNLGASEVISENVEASIQLARLALIQSGVDTADHERALEKFKDDYYSRINE